jgi:hypothetical protein
MADDQPSGKDPAEGAELQASTQAEGQAAKRKPILRDNFTSPYTKAAEKHPDSWTQRFFWVVLLVAALSVALDISTDEGDLEVKLGVVSLPVARDVVMLWIGIALAVFTTIYAMLVAHGVLIWIRESEEEFQKYRRDHAERWKNNQGGEPLMKDQLATRSGGDIVGGGLRLCNLLIPATAAVYAGFRLWG